LHALHPDSETLRKHVICKICKYHELQFHPDPACKQSENLYDIYHCCVHREKLLMMDRGTVRNMQIFIPRINLRN